MQKLTQGGIGFEKIDNAFVQLDDPAQAQRIANRFAKLPWPKILIVTAARRRVGLACAKGLAICTTINATPWPAISVTWKR
jgi:hypothetical protein